MSFSAFSKKKRIGWWQSSKFSEKIDLYLLVSFHYLSLTDTSNM